jgi:glyoxylase-like metal-dependent hydrolase (beta-lactamase superfamily II)
MHDPGALKKGLAPYAARGAVVRAIAIVFFLLLCGRSAADAGPAGEYGKVSSAKVADGIYLFTTSPYGDVGFGGNAVAILTDEGVVLFDTSGTPACGETVLGELRKLTDKPVRWVINSHWHWDHWGGNQAIKKAFPGVQFLSHEKNRDLMMQVAVPWNAPGLERDLPGYIESMKQAIAAAEAKGASAADLANRKELLAADEDFLQQKRSVTYTFPEVTFSESATLHLGGREIQVLHARAITPGDTYVYLPKERILLTGDIVVHPVPFAVGGSYPQDWIATLENFIALPADIVIPGHGEAQRDKTYLKQNLRLFQHTLADVRKAKAQGMTLEQTRKAMVRNATTYAADLGLADRMLAAFKNYFLDVFINRAYHELEQPLGDNPAA